MSSSEAYISRSDFDSEQSLSAGLLQNAERERKEPALEQEGASLKRKIETSEAEDLKYFQEHDSDWKPGRKLRKRPRKTFPVIRAQSKRFTKTEIKVFELQAELEELKITTVDANQYTYLQSENSILRDHVKQQERARKEALAAQQQRESSTLRAINELQKLNDSLAMTLFQETRKVNKLTKEKEAIEQKYQELRENFETTKKLISACIRPYSRNEKVNSNVNSNVK